MQATHTPETRIVFFVLGGPGEDKLNYKEIYYLKDKKVALQAFRMAQLFQDAVDTKDLRFDFEKALNIAKDKKNMMAVVRTLNQTVTRQDDSASVMVQEVLKLLTTILSVELTGGQQQKLKDTLDSSFTNLKKEQADTWIFWQHESAHQVTYTYNIMFAIQDDNTGVFLAGLPIGMEITVDISKEKVLFLTLEDKHNFSVTIKAISVVQPLES
jgi:hypothetical protein